MSVFFLTYHISMRILFSKKLVWKTIEFFTLIDSAQIMIHQLLNTTTRSKQKQSSMLGINF